MRPAMARLTFASHARDQMRVRALPEVAVYHVVEDYDRRIDRVDGVAEYLGTWNARELPVVLRWADEGEDDGYVITVVDTATRRRRRR